MIERAAPISNTFEIEEATIPQLQTAMAKAFLSSEGLVNYYLGRIEKRPEEQAEEQAKKPAEKQAKKQTVKQADRKKDPLSSLISLNPQAKSIAAELDKERSADNLYGPLHGIPIVVKDNIDTVQLPTTGGCAALASSQPPDDAFVVARLREAGAIILAKANLQELGQGTACESSLGGQTLNPYDLAYTPGGASGGTAAAIAANLATAGLGSDTEGSIRSSAAACNLVGLRPTTGLVSRDGLMPTALSQDVIGPMGRRVTDVATLLDVIAVDDPEDPMTARSTGKLNSSYRPFLKKSGLKGMRLGVISSLYGTGSESKGVNELMAAAHKTCTALGAQQVPVAATIDVSGLAKELSVIHWEFKLHFEQYLETVGSTAPVKTLKEILKSGMIHSSVETPLKLLNSTRTPLGDADYWRRLYPLRVELRQLLTQLFNHHQLDAIVYPSQQQPVSKLGQVQQGLNGFLAAGSGFPAITVPAGFLDNGLPVGLELMAMPFQEARLLQMAYAYEQKTQWRRAPAL
ncbi:MAG: amidase family protein [Cyanobacteria bacterium J06632_3]